MGAAAAPSPFGRTMNKIAQLMPRLVNAETSADYLGRGRSKFYEQVKDGIFPQPSDRNGSVPLWDVHLLDLYVDQLSGLTPQVSGWDL